jgi:hypothetical protein
MALMNDLFGAVNGRSAAREANSKKQTSEASVQEMPPNRLEIREAALRQ